MSFILLTFIFTLISICLCFAQYQLDILEERLTGLEQTVDLINWSDEECLENEVDD